MSKKTPALTSPSKIGFFVSLIIVSLSAGVSYFFMRSFSLSWGLAPFEPSGEWFRTELWLPLRQGEGFLYRLLPLVAIIAMSSVAAYFLIRRAVYRYKSYVDSGLDYKTLIESLHDIRDLEDTADSGRLHRHPELRKFLTRIREQVSSRMTELNEREEKLATRVDRVTGETQEKLTKQLNEDCERIVDVLREAEQGVPDDFGLATLELRRVEDAIRAQWPIGGGDGNPGGDDGAADDLRTRTAEHLGAIAEDFATMQAAAANVEQQLAQVTSEVPKDFDPAVDAPFRRDMETITASAQSFETLAESLQSLGEDAKGIAINTALKASEGDGGHAELIQLAEDVREVASRFTATSRSCQQLSGDVRESIVRLQQGMEQVLACTCVVSKVVESSNTAASRVASWVQRMDLLSARLTELHSTMTSPVESATDEEHSAANEFVFEHLDGRSVFSNTPERHDEEQSGQSVFGDVASDDVMFTELKTDAADKTADTVGGGGSHATAATPDADEGVPGGDGTGATGAGDTSDEILAVDNGNELDGADTAGANPSVNPTVAPPDTEVSSPDTDTTPVESETTAAPAADAASEPAQEPAYIQPATRPVRVKTPGPTAQDREAVFAGVTASDSRTQERESRVEQSKGPRNPAKTESTGRPTETATAPGVDSLPRSTKSSTADVGGAGDITLGSQFDPDNDVIDLYDLGAVDYDSTVHGTGQ